MTRQEHDRENLLEDATAYARRIEFRTPTGGELFVGFRTGGAASVYLDQDPVYHFTSSGELRRAYVAGQLIKANRGQLVSMRRERTGGEVQLVSHVMSDERAQQLLDQICHALAEAAKQLERQELVVVGQVPDDADVQGELRQWLAERLASPLAIARSPRAK